MCRRLLLLLSLILSFASVGAQTQTVTLSGQLRSGTEPVAGAVLALLQPSDSSLLTYTISDSEGRYRLQLETSLPALVLRVRSLGFKRRLLHLKAQSQTLDLNLEHEEHLLREVIVKAQKLWAQRDTLNYLVSAYTLQQDRTIGDVLQRLPGITIEDNKVIKYQGLPINRFYIEGLDLLRGRYGLATQGIRAQDIATVQVLEHTSQCVPSRTNRPLSRQPSTSSSRTELRGSGPRLFASVREATLQARCGMPRFRPCTSGRSDSISSATAVTISGRSSTTP